MALIPTMFAFVLDALRRTFAPRLDFVGSFFVLPYYVLFQGILVIWSAYILAVSVRSVSNLNLEKTLVVVLVIVVVAVQVVRDSTPRIVREIWADAPWYELPSPLRRDTVIEEEKDTPGFRLEGTKPLETAKPLAAGNR
jgi:hypothetical protein